MFSVHVENLVKSYGDRRVLDRINLDVQEGQFYALMGPNGSGKTTLSSIIAAVKTQDSGIVEVYGKKPAQAREFTHTYIAISCLHPGIIPCRNYCRRSHPRARSHP